jgi:hypothetical protein
VSDVQANTGNTANAYPNASADDLFRTGVGNWAACVIPLPQLLQVTESWRTVFAGIELPWLCWNVDSDWCLLQQRLVRKVGWTPVVGFDPRVGPPPLAPGAVLVDFNERFGLPTMYPHFPMEFIFNFCQRLAFWHSDLLVPLPVMQRLADSFAALRAGEIAAVLNRGGLRKLLKPWAHRYWELIGCSTASASRDQFELGAGWWYNFVRHPNFRDSATILGQPYYWDHGTGIMYWARARKARVHRVPESLVAAGHFTSIGTKNYQRKSPNTHMRDLSADLRANFDLARCAEQMGLTDLLRAG